jgi:HK97 family phage major capsid protein
MTEQQLVDEYNAATRDLKAARDRGLDPQTLAAAERKMLALGGRLASARSDASFMDSLNGMAGGMHGRGGRSSGLSIGAQFVNSETFKWLQGMKNRFPSTPWTSPSSELTGFGQMMAATLTSDAASGGDLIITDYQSGILPLPQRELTIADLMAPGTTTSNAVGYMKETTATNAGATVAEGATKPESTLIFDAVTDPVRKIATWIPVTEEMLEDVPSLQAYLDTRLRLFIQLVEDDQLLNGDGTAPNISGILDRPGIAAPIARTTETNPDVILKQISAIEQATKLPVDGVVMHPTNWDSILLLKDADGNYIAGGGPFAMPQRKTLWGRKVAVTPAVTLGTAVVGAWKTASQFFRKGGIRVESSNAHSDFFVKDLVAVRAEERGALAVYRENAFGKVTNLA